MNVCGNTSFTCTPSYPVYQSGGAIIQNFGPWQPPCATGTCINVDTGALSCCNDDCVVLATDYYMLDVIDPTNPAHGGVRISFAPMSAKSVLCESA
jgi:hypothetical protein